MKRVVCGALLGVAALAAVPASASDTASCLEVQPIVWTGEYGRYGAGAMYRTNCSGGYVPFGGAWVGPEGACVGFSYQIPVCTGGVN